MGSENLLTAVNAEALELNAFVDGDDSAFDLVRRDPDSGAGTNPGGQLSEAA